MDQVPQILGMVKSFLDTLGMTPFLLAFVLIGLVAGVISLLFKR
jgi:hypothetical protein